MATEFQCGIINSSGEGLALWSSDWELTFQCGARGFVPGQETKFPHAEPRGQKKIFDKK